MKKIVINASTKYDLLIGQNLLQSAGELSRAVIKGGKIAVVTDSNVEKLYLQTVHNSLEAAEYNVYPYIFPAGERSKCAAEYAKILSFLADCGLTRADAVVALGGGVTGDLAGFAAATYMRGIRYIQIPTTLLAMVDSSVGGKTGIDLPEGKNLAGVFWQPSLVIADADTLQTLSPAEIKNGAAEIIKAGVLAGFELWDLLESGAAFTDGRVIALSAEYKKSVVESDEFEGGLRRLLNLGHTAGHAIELLSGYKIPHGAAVAKGLKLILDTGVKRGITGEETRNGIIKQLERAGLDTSLPFNINMSPQYTLREISRICAGDKKASDGNISLVVVHGIGDCRILSLPVDELEGFFYSAQ